MTFPEYRSIAATNWSLLEELSKSPAHYRHRLANPRPDTARMQLGRLVHCAVLEPDALPERYAVWNASRRGNAWTDFAAAAFTNGMEVVTSAEYEKALAIRDAVQGNLDAASLLTGGEAEVTLLWTDEATGIACKGRADYLTDTALIELKTTASIEERKFLRSCDEFDYYGQLAFYNRSINRAEVVLIAVESDPPHDVGVFDPDDDFLWLGNLHVDERLALLKHCTETGDWHGRYVGRKTLSPPDYLLNQLEDATSDLVFGGEDA